MLKITVPAVEMFDEVNQEFIEAKEQTLQLEHSLVSLSKWESKWHKAFLSQKDKTLEETIDYIRCMTVTQNVDPSVYSRLTRDNLDEIEQYIANPMTATYIPEDPMTSASGDTVTSELIYYWMISLNIPQEYQKWHLNRLISLIKVCTLKNNPNKKMSQAELLRRHSEINKARRKKRKAKG